MNEEELIQRTRTLIRKWDNVRIVGAGWSGDARRGFQFNPVQASFSPSGTTPPPPTPSGACCPEEGDCFISTQSVCEGGGGTYQGDDTTCEPDPCPQPPATGACCVGTDCSIETEDDCTGMGGVYQGDDTTCDPNPCEEVECSCGFNAFDGSPRRFLTQTWTVDGYYHWDDDDAVCGSTFCTLTMNFTKTSTYDPNTCELTTSCEGSYQYDAELYPAESRHESGDWCTANAGCGSCAGDCEVPLPGGVPPSCFTTDCSCSATQVDCFHEDSTENLCNCAAGRPPTVTGNCSVTQTVTLSNECIPV